MSKETDWNSLARVSRDAATHLIQQNAFAGPAASRAYYAMYQTVVALLIRQGYTSQSLPFQLRREGRVLRFRHWKHEVVALNLRVAGLLQVEAELFLLLRMLRITADYGPRPVNWKQTNLLVGRLCEMMKRVGFHDELLP